MQTQKFHVPGISCQHCVNAVMKEVSALGGVEKVDVVLDSKTVTVAHADTVSREAIVDAIKDAGYDEVENV